MSAKKPNKREGNRPTARDDTPAHGSMSTGIRVERTKSGDAWMLVHPPCTRQRAEDMEEVREMIDAGATDVATDELRWLLEGCSDFIEAHRLLGELALSEKNDLPLARGHFGAAYQLGLTSLRRAGSPTPLPYRLPANQDFFTAGKCLARCLHEMGKTHMAIEVLEHLLTCDSTDPLDLHGMLAEMRA